MGDLSMLLNVSDREESRIAVVEDHRLEEFHIERASRETQVGNIYKGKVENVHHGLQAAFVILGLERNGFLHVSEAHCANMELGRPRRPIRRGVPMERIMGPGQDIYVQVTRDEFGEKGPTLTTEITLPGKFTILTPTSDEIIVAKKIAHPGLRNKMRKLIDDLRRDLGLQDLPGLIIKAAAAGAEPRDVQADFEHVAKMWRDLQERARKPGPQLVYKEPGLVIRWIRDYFKKAITEIVVDGSAVYNRIGDYLDAFMPQYRERLRRYEDPTPLFHHYRIEKQIEELSQPIVMLPGGGRLHIEETEALTAIDVNSGGMRDTNPESLALRTNLESAREIMRQIRLRDLGGIIVMDFIDMRLLKNVMQVEKTIHDEAQKDRAQMTILPMSRFCLLEMARQKMRASVELISHEPCPACGGTGIVKNLETIGLDLLRTIKQNLESERVSVIEVRVHPDVATFLRGKMDGAEAIEARYGKKMHIFSVRELPTNRAELICYDHMGEKVVDEIR